MQVQNNNNYFNTEADKAEGPDQVEKGNGMKRCASTSLDIEEKQLKKRKVDFVRQINDVGFCDPHLLGLPEELVKLIFHYVMSGGNLYDFRHLRLITHRWLDWTTELFEMNLFHFDVNNIKRVYKDTFNPDENPISYDDFRAKLNLHVANRLSNDFKSWRKYKQEDDFKLKILFNSTDLKQYYIDIFAENANLEERKLYTLEMVQVMIDRALRVFWEKHHAYMHDLDLIPFQECNPQFFSTSTDRQLESAEMLNTEPKSINWQRAKSAAKALAGDECPKLLKILENIINSNCSFHKAIIPAWILYKLTGKGLTKLLNKIAQLKIVFAQGDFEGQEVFYNRKKYLEKRTTLIKRLSEHPSKLPELTFIVKTDHHYNSIIKPLNLDPLLSKVNNAHIVTELVEPSNTRLVTAKININEKVIESELTSYDSNYMILKDLSSILLINESSSINYTHIYLEDATYTAHNDFIFKNSEKNENEKKTYLEQFFMDRIYALVQYMNDQVKQNDLTIIIKNPIIKINHYDGGAEIDRHLFHGAVKIEIRDMEPYGYHSCYDIKIHFNSIQIYYNAADSTLEVIEEMGGVENLIV